MDSSETQELTKEHTTDHQSEKFLYHQKSHISHLSPDHSATTFLVIIREPFQWLHMLCKELNTSFVIGVVLVYGFSQGFSSSFFRVVTDYYWKDVQKVQPSAVQLFIGLYYIPWLMKPIWGLLTDVFPIRGYQRRPYFIIAGVLGVASALTVAIGAKLSVLMALLCLIGVTAGVAIADVMIDACIARNSIEKPALASDMQSLCMFCSSVGALIGYSTSGMSVHHLGSQESLGVLAMPAVSLIVLGFFIYELRSNRPSEKKALEKVGGAMSGMYTTMKCPQVWQPALYMYLSLALSISTHEGQFYWFTDPKAGPAFSQEIVGAVYAIGALASIVGILIYHKLLKDYPFRNLLFCAQLLYAISGVLDLVFVLRWNLKLGIPDYFFVVTEECVSRIIARIRWMPMMVLNTKLCPVGIEGTFFALLMCIDSFGALSSKWGGGMVLHVLHVTRTDFTNLWLALLIRNLLRFATLSLIFLIPKGSQSDVMVPSDLLRKTQAMITEDEGLQLVAMDEKVEP
ncbi:probable folate-biopterin transporter 6 [Macadamia integrifolia]|uniref:probable folate-biopterin transporter 6 n=1 Tax=Macadamia integrifolia TaxID=60698 RepID=UPI001C4F0609|nr:probable folate-biopterin transporter 6 [Macadamia integrifolia]